MKSIFLGLLFFENAVTYGEIETTFLPVASYKKYHFRTLVGAGITVYAHARTGQWMGKRFGAEEGFGYLAEPNNDL